jgi:PASTA domain
MPRTVGIVVEPGQLQVEPGSTGRLSVRVVNRSQVVDQFVVVVLGLDERMTPQPQRLGLFPEQEATATFDLAVPAEQPPPAGPRVIGIRVTSQDDPRLSRVEEVQLTIGAAPAASIKVQPTRIRGGRTGRFSVQVSNDGNVPVQVALRGEDDAEEVQFQFDPPVVDVPPGSAVETYGKARAHRPFSGPETQRPITVYGEGGPVPLAARATFAQRSFVGSRVLQAVLALVALLAVLAVVLATRPRNGPTTNAVDQVSDTATASASPTPSPSPTPSATGNGEGPVPDVSGSGAADAAGKLAQGGFNTEQKPQHSNTVPAGQVIGTDPGPGQQAATADHKVTLLVSDGPTPPVDLRTEAKNADWSNGTVGLVLNGTDTPDPRGYVLIRENAQLEDGTTAPRVLETVPENKPNGFIVGQYTLPQPIIAGDFFVSRTSFLQGNVGLVDFRILVKDPATGQFVEAGKVNQRANNDVGTFKVDLTKFAGADTIQLRVDAGDSADGDAALWVNPHITGTPGTQFD